jgi:CHRD domain
MTMKACFTLVLVVLIGVAFPAAFSVAEVSAPNVLKNEAPLFAVLLGGNEVSDEGDASVGDTDGRGSASILINSAQGTLCFAITVSGVSTPNAAHIHQNVAGANGAIVVGFTSVPTTGNPGAASGCISGVATALLNNIKRNPSGFYVNVHTADFPAGAIRGQLF